MIIGTTEKHKAASDWSEALVFYSEVRTVSYKVSDVLAWKIKYVDKKSSKVMKTSLPSEKYSDLMQLLNLCLTVASFPVVKVLWVNILRLYPHGMHMLYPWVAACL